MMKKYAVFVIGIFLLALLEVSWLKPLGWASPGPLLVFLIFCLFLLPFMQVLGLAIIAGIILEMFSTFPFGILSGSLLASVLVCAAVYRWFLAKRHAGPLLVLVLIGSTIFLVFHYFLVALIVANPGYFWIRMGVLLVPLIFNFALALLLLLASPGIFEIRLEVKK